MAKVTKSTRAGKNGKYIICPGCKGAAKVYNFSFSALTCQWCKISHDKYDWELVK